MRRLTELTIIERLAAGFGLLLLLLALGLAVVARWHSESARSQVRFTETILPRQEAAGELERSLLYVAITTRSYLIRPDGQALEEYQSSVDRARLALHGLASAGTGARERRQLLAVQTAAEQYLAQSGDAVSHRMSGSFNAAEDILLTDAREEALDLVRTFVAQQVEERDATLATVARSRSAVANALLVGSMLAVLLFSALAALTVYSVRRPIRELVGVAGALERGDWGPALAWAPDAAGGMQGGVSSRDELSLVARAFGRAAAALRTRERRLQSGERLAAALGSSLDARDVAGRALDIVMAHTGAQIGVIYRRAEGGSELHPIADHALRGQARALRVGEGLPGEVARSGRPAVWRGLPEDSGFRVRLGHDEAGARTLAAVPIVFQGETRGVLLVGSVAELDDESVGFLELAATQLGVALQNVTAHEQIQEKTQEIQAQNEEIQAQNEEIQSQTEELRARHDQLRGHAEAMARQARALAEADAQKNEFLGILAHELRNPLSAITNSLFVLHQTPVASEQAERSRAIIERQSSHLSRLIDDLLDLTRISRGKIQVQRGRVDLADVARKCIEDYDAAAEQGGVRLQAATPESPVWVNGDWVRLCQVVGNLLSNSIKFTPSDGRVAVSVHADERSDRAVVQVTDEGRGIEPHLLPQLFQPFWQGEAGLDRSESGLGLGLALVKGLVELHGGTVEARSEGRGRGATFEVRLPLAKGAEPQPAPRPMTAQAGVEPCRVLVIEDSADAAESLREVLRLQGHQVEVAQDGPQGMTKARGFHPDVVLCDVGLPGMDGYAIARAFRRDPEMNSVLLVALTGYARPDDQALAAEAGFHEHLAKPPRLDRLAEILGKAPRHSSHSG